MRCSSFGCSVDGAFKREGVSQEKYLSGGIENGGYTNLPLIKVEMHV